MEEVRGTPSSLDGARTGPGRLWAEATRLHRELRSVRDRLEELVATAIELDERHRSLVPREEDVRRRLARVEIEEEALTAKSTELDERETILDADKAELDQRMQWLADEQAWLTTEMTKLAEQTEQLEEQRAGYLRRWGWLARSWRQRPWPSPLRPCDRFFVPTPDGYKLLPQAGIGVVPGAVLTGLLEEERTYVVTRIAPWPFDDQWCAYLAEHEQSDGGEIET
jgi:hypothetical protein